MGDCTVKLAAQAAMRKRVLMERDEKDKHLGMSFGDKCVVVSL